MRHVGAANHQLDAQITQVTFVRQQNALELGLGDQKLQLHRVALCIYHLVVDDLPARFLQQLEGPALLWTNHATAIGYRQREGFGEHSIRNLAAQRFKNFQFFGGRQAAGGHFRVVEIAFGAAVRAVEQLFVGPLEVQQQSQRLTDPDVLKHRLAQVEDKTLHARRIAIGKLFLDQPAIPDCWRVICSCPVLGAGFHPIIELPGFARFQRDGVVAIVVGGQHIEVVEALIDRQVLGPVILDPFIAHRAPGFYIGDLVRPAAQREVQVALAEVAICPKMFGQHG